MKKSSSFFVNLCSTFCVFLLQLSLHAEDEFRHWTTSKGIRSTVKLTVVEVKNGTVKLKRKDNGNIIALALEQLSKSDREYLKQSQAQDISNSPATPVPKSQLQPFVQQYCVECHGAAEQNGQVRFDQDDWVISHNDEAQRWQDVLDVLNSGDMPPENAKQPENEQLAKALDALTSTLLTARKRLTDHGGEITLRRLNRREYSATIRDLFGFDVAFDDIPEDGEITSFDTVGSEQFFSSAHFEKYLELGKKIAQESFRFNLNPRGKVSVERNEVEKRVTQRMRDRLADLDKKMALKKSGATWREMGFKDEGEMEIVFRQWDARAELPRAYLQYPLVDKGVYISDVAKWASAGRNLDIRAEYIVRIHGGIQGQPGELRRIVRVWDNYRTLGTIRFNGTTSSPESVELRARQPMGRIHLGVKVRENMPENTVNSMHGYLNKIQGNSKRTDPRAAVWVDWIEIEGPYYPQLRPKIENILFPNKSTGSGSPYIWNESKTKEFIEKVAFEAFRRRQPKAEYIDGLHAIFQKNRSAGMSHRDALTEVLGIILASPGFLFLQEEASRHGVARVNARNGKTSLRTDKSGSVKSLSNRELAIRLSYFLWSCPPDEELYSANLSDFDVYAEQVDRMLADPKVKNFRDGFISQWAEFDKYDAITIDNRKHFRFNEGVQEDAKREVREFFGTLITENLPSSNLIDSDFVTINAALAAHYDLDTVDSKSDEFQKVKLPVHSPRGGLATTTAFLVSGSNGERSSPVIRGALIMEKLLHDKPAPPPPNVPELDEASNTPKSNREMVELHQQRAVCASCHKKMDVIGFGLENFDTTGRWRDNEKVGGKLLPIEPGGTLPDGSAFKNVQELKSVLLQHKDELAKEILKSMLTYAIGRTIEFSDTNDVEALMDKLKPGEFRVRSMIREIALSPIFQRP